MNHFLNTSLAALAAFVLTIGSIGAVVSVPPAQAEVPVAFTLPAIA